MILAIAKNIPGWLSPEPLVPLMRFFYCHHFENVNNRSRQNIKKSGRGMSNMHPAVTILQQLNIRGRIRIFKFQQVQFDNPAIFCRQAVNVLQRPLVDVYSHDASLFLRLCIRDRCRVRQILPLLRLNPGGQ